MNKILIGIDIGGTAVKFGFLSIDGELIHKWSIPTNTEKNGAFIVSEMWGSLEEKLTSMDIPAEQLVGIGVGVPGFISDGIIHEAVNLGWKNKDVEKELTSLSGLPTFIENDANVAALGEYWSGAGKNGQDVLVLTLGTGVGGGVISDGNIITGTAGMAGEFGHILIEENGAPCNCGNRGCLETIASATGIVRLAKELIALHPDSPLAVYERENDQLDASDVFRFAKNGDDHANQIVDRVGDVLGRTIANLGVIFNPELVLLGGGVSKAGTFLLDRVESYFHRYALPRVKATCEIKLAGLGNDAGIIGAAYLVKQNMEEK